MKLKTSLKKISNSRNFKHGILYTLFSFFNNGISFILILILSKFLTPGQYGYLNLFTTFVTLVNIIITLGTISYIGVSFFQKKKEELQQIISIVLSTTTLVLLLCIVILILFPVHAEQIIGVPIRFLWYGIIICYFQIFNNINLDIWRLEEKPKYYGIYSITFAICNFILTFYYIVGLHFGWEGRVYAWFILGILYFIISIIFLIRRKYLKLTIPSYNLIKETLYYALPMIPHSISFWLKSGLDRYIINYYYDQVIVGYFSFAANLAAIITMIGTAFNATNSVNIYKKLSNGCEHVKSSLKEQTKIMTITFALITVAVIIFTWLLITCYIPKYLESVQYIIPLCISGFFQCIYLLWVNYLFFFKKTKILMYITLSTAIIQLSFSLWLTKYSPINTAIISMIVMAITMMCVRYASKKYLSTFDVI